MINILKQKALLLFLVLFASTFVVNAQQDNEQYKGIGFEALDYEKQSGFEVSNSAYLLLDSIVKECKSKITVKQSYSYEEAIEILSTIGSVIRSHNIKYDTLGLYSEALANKKLDCKFFSLTYLTVGEFLSLPLYSMIAPKHVFINWKDNNNELFWETTDNFEQTRQHYIDSLKIPLNTISSGAYMTGLDYEKSFCIIYSYCGRAKFSIGVNEGAIVDYTKAIEINPEYADAYYNRGTAKSALNDQDRAIVDFTKAIEINPEDADAYYNRGIAKSGIGDNNGAIEDYSKSIEINDNNADSYYSRGNAKSKLADDLAAIQDYNMAIGLNPKYAEAYSNRGISKKKLGDNKNALLDFNKSIEINPKDASAYSKRGNAKSALNDKDGAIEDLTKAIELSPDYASAYYNRAVVKYNNDDLVGACADWKRASELGDKEADEMIKKFCK